ncbi:MAG: ABC-F family ATP-binding cassette domain-containing protein [Candidatus Aminicenantes bacterium]|nr:ABC-F family ATP-binding cassette domain-containing protein [Candidatus Aminicenantes bacterium]
MVHPFIKFNHVSFSYGTSAKPLIENLTLHLSRGWTGLVGANGCGKTTFIKLAAGELTPIFGHIQIPGHSVYCPQRTDDIPEKAAEFFASNLRSAKILSERLKLDFSWLNAWSHISHGMRKRLQTAIALWQEPDVLALDEPFNHLDLPSIICLENALMNCLCSLFLASHDRVFLKKLTAINWQIQCQYDGSFQLTIAKFLLLSSISVKATKINRFIIGYIKILTSNSPLL